MGAVFVAVVVASLCGAIVWGFVILILAGIRLTHWIRRKRRERRRLLR